MKPTLIALLLLAAGCNIHESSPDSVSTAEAEDRRWEKKKARLDSVQRLKDSLFTQTWNYLYAALDHIGTKKGMRYNDSARMCNEENSRLISVTDTIWKNP